MKIDKEQIDKNIGEIKKEAKRASASVSDKTKELTEKSKGAVVKTIDVSGDGKISIDDIIILGLKTPGIGINRSDFLRKELTKNYSPKVIALAISTTPANAGISIEEIDIIAENVIRFERTCVTGISTALNVSGSIPVVGTAAMVASIPADIVQYYGFMLRAAQKLMYLYGFPEIDVSEDSPAFDSETLNILTICLGVMYGVAGANNAIKVMAKALAGGVEKKLINQALTKGTLFPIVRKIATWFEVKMTKAVFAGFFKKAIPVVGGLIGGGITYMTFKPCCDNLKASLRVTKLSNPDYDDSNDDDDDIIIDTEYSEV